MLIIGTRFLIFCLFASKGFEGCLSHSKSLGPKSHKWRNLNQVHTYMFPLYHPYTITYVGLSVELPSYASDKKFTKAFKNTPTRLII